MNLLVRPAAAAKMLAGVLDEERCSGRKTLYLEDIGYVAVIGIHVPDVRGEVSLVQEALKEAGWVLAGGAGTVSANGAGLVGSWVLLYHGIDGDEQAMNAVYNSLNLPSPQYELMKFLGLV